MQTYRNFIAEVMADSIIRYKIGGKPHSHRLTTFRVVIPRMVLAELNTHRLASRNSASSRARPITKMIEDVLTNPFIPDRFPRKHKGVQAEKESWLQWNGKQDYSVRNSQQGW
jgi:predicted ribonuclease YlaK